MVLIRLVRPFSTPVAGVCAADAWVPTCGHGQIFRVRLELYDLYIRVERLL